MDDAIVTDRDNHEGLKPSKSVPNRLVTVGQLAKDSARDADRALQSFAG